MSSTDFEPVLSKLLSSLSENEKLSGVQDQELRFLETLLRSKEINALVNVHHKVQVTKKDDRIAPILSASMQVVLEILEQLAPRCHISSLCKELFHLLQNNHIQSLLCAHDAVAQKDFYPHLPEIPIEVDEDEETIKIVQLVKSVEPLNDTQNVEPIEPIVGATIKSCEETGKIIIARIMIGGAADRSGLINVGDEVIEVNNINVEGKTPADVLTILQNSEGIITFKLIPTDGKANCRESKVRVKALFDYSPENDPYIPCKEAGLGFSKGEVLHIVSQDDHWWQARKEFDKITRAGLIPSRSLQERRIIHERSQASKDNFENQSKTENDDFDREEIATYEEVAKLYPRSGLYRPIILIGAPGVGRNELVKMLVDTDPEKYKCPIPYTSRQKRPNEISGREYLFVSRDKIESDIENNKFIEHGEFKGQLYGTTAQSVKTIIDSGALCILSPHHQAIKALRTPQLKPYFIFIRAPSFEDFKRSRNSAKAISSFDETGSRGFNEEEIHEVIKSSERIDFLFGHYFDETIVNMDLEKTFRLLQEAIQKFENEPTWAPVAWCN